MNDLDTHLAQQAIVLTQTTQRNLHAAVQLVVDEHQSTSQISNAQAEQLRTSVKLRAITLRLQARENSSKTRHKNA